MDLAAIGAASIERSLANVQQAAGVKLMKGAMEQQESQAAQLLEAIAQAAPPSTNLLDTYA